MCKSEAISIKRELLDKSMDSLSKKLTELLRKNIAETVSKDVRCKYEIKFNIYTNQLENFHITFEYYMKNKEVFRNLLKNTMISLGYNPSDYNRDKFEYVIDLEKVGNDYYGISFMLILDDGSVI